jgi:hypothetical protein
VPGLCLVYQMARLNSTQKEYFAAYSWGNIAAVAGFLPPGPSPGAN